MKTTEIRTQFKVRRQGAEGCECQFRERKGFCYTAYSVLSVAIYQRDNRNNIDPLARAKLRRHRVPKFDS